jgi:hypothetical protein
MKTEDIGSVMKNYQFMIHVLHNLTRIYELQMVLQEQRIGSKVPLLENDELEEGNLQFRETIHPIRVKL